MILHDVVQGTPEWLRARIGIPTASNFDEILTPAKGDYSASAAMYENQIVAEIFSGESQEDFGGTTWTERGKEYEPEAVAYYELERGIDVVHGCFATNDKKTFGASPDGFAGDDGLIEIKCLSGKHHVSVLLNPEKAVKYRPQIQGQMLVTGRKWVDHLYYHPKLPKLIIRTERDEAFIIKLETAIDQFIKNVAEKIKQIKGE